MEFFQCGANRNRILVSAEPGNSTLAYFATNSCAGPLKEVKAAMSVFSRGARVPQGLTLSGLSYFERKRKLSLVRNLRASHYVDAPTP